MSFPVVEYITAFVALYGTIFYFLLLTSYKKQLHSEAKLLPRKELPSVSIIIPALNEQGTISKTIRSVFEMNYPRNLLEIIVVDDGSTDGTIAEVKRFSKQGVKLVINEHKGIGKSSALNAGIRKASGELIATLDSDSFPQKNCLHKLVSFFSDESVTAATAAIKVNEPKNWLEKIQSVEYIFVMFSRRLLAFLDCVSVTPGPMSVFRRGVFKKVGLFDENSILEDQEMAYRLQANNCKIVSSMDAEVFTQVPRTFNDLLRQRVRWNRGGLRNFYKHKSLFSTRYGDFGSIVMPLALLTVLLVVGIFGLVAWQIITGQFFSWFSLEAIIYAFGGIQMVSLLILLLALAWLYVGRKVFEDEKNTLSISKMLLFLVAYTYFSSVFWLATFGEEMFGKKQKW